MNGTFIAKVFLSIVVASAVTTLRAETFLLPLPPGVIPGAFGSRWETEVWAHNASERLVTLLPAPVIAGTDGIVVAPRRSALITPYADAVPFASRAAVVSVDDDSQAKNVKFEIIVRELTFQRAFGFEVPAVPLSSFSTGPLDVMNVPIDRRFRVTLRLYADGAAPLALRLYDLANDGVPLLERRILIDAPPALPPNYVDSGVGVATMTEMFEAARSANVQRARLEIVPTAPNARFWAFASVTDNETQYVTILLPK